METAIKERLKGQLVKGDMRGRVVEVQCGKWECLNDMLRRGTTMSEVFDSGLLLLKTESCTK